VVAYVMIVVSSFGTRYRYHRMYPPVRYDADQSTSITRSAIMGLEILKASIGPPIQSIHIHIHSLIN